MTDPVSADGGHAVHVIATAGHVDHGKSTLVRALTGMEPDRWAEERRRGMTIDLGFAWTRLSSDEVAFVDVPGHERFISNMLAGIGPVPAALMVVAADEGWMPQSAEHLAALDALGVRYGLLAVTKTDVADPVAVIAHASDEIAATSLGGVVAVGVSAVTGEGLDALRAALDRLVARLPQGDLAAPVRLWIDRVFTIRGSGTVVTGTLPRGELRPGDRLQIADTSRTVHIRGLQTLGRPVDQVGAVARVAVNLRGVDRSELRRGDALVTPDQYYSTSLIDVRSSGDPVAALPEIVMLHAGSAAVSARLRPLGSDTARLRMARSLPLHIGDRLLLRDPGGQRPPGGVTVLDVAPPALRRRGAAAARASVLAGIDGIPDEATELARRGLVRIAALQRMGVPVQRTPVAGDWLADPDEWARLLKRLAAEVAAHAERHPLSAGMPMEELRHVLGLPDRALIHALAVPPLVVRDGRVHADGTAAELPAQVAGALRTLRAEFADSPFTAPGKTRLAELGLGRPELAAAERAGELIRVAEGIVLPAGAPALAASLLAGLPQPFTVSMARQALRTTRRVALPLLELLDLNGTTRRLPDDRRIVVSPNPQVEADPP